VVALDAGKSGIALDRIQVCGPGCISGRLLLTFGKREYRAEGVARGQFGLDVGVLSMVESAGLRHKT
jgi:hypothetical protein